MKKDIHSQINLFRKIKISIHALIGKTQTAGQRKKYIRDRVVRFRE